MNRSPAAQRPCVARRLGAAALAASALLAAWSDPARAQTASAPSTQADAAWLLVGQQGLVRVVIVPGEQATDRAAYERQLARLCTAGDTCFVNFYTNSTGAPLALPLPDAVFAEPTATWRFSAKNGMRRFIWSCRMKVRDEACF